MRAAATRRARPALASHAENARSSIGDAAKLVTLSSKAQMDRAKKRDSIIPSRHKRADNKCARLNARPERARTKAVEKANCVGVIKWAWT